MKEQRDEKGRFLENNDIGSLGGKPPVFPTVEDFQKVIDGYLESCKGYDKDGNLVFKTQPLKSGLAFFAKCSKDAIIDTSKRGGGYSKAFKEFESVCEYFAEQALYNPKRNVAGAIFNLKANYGYRDNIDIRHEGELKTKNELTIKVVRDKQVEDDPDEDTA